LKATEAALPDRCDVLVIGAGPAGSCAARSAADVGADTCLIEEDEAIGLPVRCAEGVSARAYRAFLGTPDPELVRNRIRFVRLSGPSGRGVTMASELEGYILDRSRFDPALAERAAGAGARVVTGARAAGMERSGGRWVVRVRHDGTEHPIAARIVIGADGIVSRVGRWGGLDTGVPPALMESCHQYCLGNLDVPADTIELAYGDRIAPGGYGWVFPRGGGEANVGLGVVRHRSSGSLSAKEHLDRWVAERFPEAVRCGETGGGVIIAPTLERISADGLLLAGDAAHQINPLSGAGISSGMRAGLLAGTIAAAACRCDRTEARYLRRYDRRWRRMLGRLHADHYRLADIITRLSDETREALVTELEARPTEKRRLYTAVSAAVRRHPLLLVTIVPYFRHWRIGRRRSGYPSEPL